MKHVNKLNLNENNDPFNEENWDEKEADGDKEITVRVKDIIKFLQNNFDSEAEVWLDHDGWNVYPGRNFNDVQDLILNRGIFENFRGNLIINN